MAPKWGNIIDTCSGIGILGYRLLCHDYHHGNISSLTLCEFNPEFVHIGKRLLQGMKDHTGKEYEINLITGDEFDESLWKELTGKTPTGKFDLMVSNPPYGKMSATDQKNHYWMFYTGERELMALELCLRFAIDGYFILPPCSVEFKFSGAPYYQEQPQSKVERIKKKCPIPFRMYCDGIDGSIYRDEWKGTCINTEAVRIVIDPNEF